MDKVLTAVEQFKGAPSGLRVPPPPPPPPAVEPVYARAEPDIADESQFAFEVNPRILEQNRIFGHNPLDQRSRPLDFVRTSVLQEMGTNGWRTLGVTSPGPGCGKTFSALNLALSIARQGANRVLLVDLDIARPQIAHRLGLTVDQGIRALLEGRIDVTEATTKARVGALSLDVIGCERPTSRPSDWLASENVVRLLQKLHATDIYRAVILDLPPVLAGDEAVSILPYIDCAMLVVAAGTTTTTELRECNHHIQTPVVRVLLNKDKPPPASQYY